MTEGLSELKAMTTAYEALMPLEIEARQRAMRWITSALGLEDQTILPSPVTSSSTSAVEEPRQADTRTVSSVTPKEFLAQKKPTTSAERIACLAYYLTHMRNIPKFKTVDLTNLNTEAAGPRISNATRDVDNADRGSGYIVGAGSGAKQITARGESLVAALPDRNAVKEALNEYPHKRRKSSSSKRTVTGLSEEK